MSSDSNQTPCLQTRFSNEQKTVRSEIFLQFFASCEVEFLNVTKLSDSMKRRHDHVFKASCLVLLMHESLQKFRQIPI